MDPHVGGRRLRILARVEIDQPFDLWLLARHVGAQLAHERTNERTVDRHEIQELWNTRDVGKNYRDD